MMKHLAASAAVLVLFVASVAAQVSNAIDPSAIDTLAQGSLHQQNLPGLTVAIIDHGKMVYSRAFGFSDIENQVPATPKSEIRTASIAKPMTAIAALQLAHAGKLDLDAP